MPTKSVVKKIAKHDIGKVVLVQPVLPGFRQCSRMEFRSVKFKVAAPHSPANALPVGEFGDVAIDVAYVGACTGAKLEDLRMAARVLKGRHVARGVTLMVAPASRKDEAVARREGLLATLEAAGARLLPNACGLCAGYGERFAPEAKVISTTARNFRGRMGAASTEVFLASPYTVAASALIGRIADPRAVLQ